MSTQIDYETRFLSQAAKRWKPSGIRGLFPMEQIPGMISMLAGKPNPQTFPFQSIAITLKPPVVSQSDKEELPPVVLDLSGEELHNALQYGPTSGLPPFVSWITGLQQLSHHRGDPKEEGWKCSIGAGSQELMHKAFSAICNPDDSILIETPAYAGVLGFLQPFGANLIEVPSDEYGITETHLRSVLENWFTDEKTKALKFPKMIYTCPTGSNPTGASASLPRKQQILALVRKFDLLLVEDDAYFYLHFDRPNRAPSYFELEKSEGGQTGRVIRFDSLSKVLSSGMRLGFVTGPVPILNVIDLQTSNTNLQTASLTQALACKLLTHWGYDEFIAHCDRVAAFYACKLQAVEAAAKRHLDGLAEWNRPRAGMFLWFKLNIAKPGDEDNADSNALVATTALKNGVLAVPGHEFMPSGRKTVFVRTSFSLIDEETADEGFRRLANAIKEARKEAGLDS
ncbi:hypothetical protein CROQUDRAFT_76724 [Cronartium quercuum f. sp. fusiforme G11]|uniref:Aminotransferase class I/classII large domain-containing protein n=1 Tax=Cronartium quercuum f. sp. fusiforme G11 TaxID=708437 RepID=A0A9P6NND2_9BASI|nr:hypothetical protein CROQUDRAFT_76724 [Cronartium quercuum f. sp. fusiforme G11]